MSPMTLFENWKIQIRLIVLIACLFIFAGLIQAEDQTATSTPPVPLTIQKIAEILRESEPAYTSAEADAIVSEMIPWVERMTERKLKTSPTVTLMGRKGMADVLLADLKPLYTALFSSYTPDQVTALCLEQSKALAFLVLGKYGLKDQTLYLTPTNFTPILNLMHVPKELHRPLLKLIIAHELVHVLQDQETDLQRSWQLKSIDEVNAFFAAIEGHAMLIQERIGRNMGMEDSVVEMSRMLSAGTITFDDPLLQMLTNISATLYEQIYLGGKKFVEYHYSQGGNARVWEMIAKPPVKTAMITEPQTYSPIQVPEMDYSALFEFLTRTFTAEEWTTRNLVIGQMQLRSFYANLDKKNSELILSQIIHTQCFLAQNKDQQRTFSVSAIIFNKDDFSKTYIALLEEMAQKNVKELESSSLITIKDFLLEDLPDVQADKARKISFTISKKDKEESSKTVIIRISRGKVLLEFFPLEMAISDDFIISLAKNIFSKYIQLNANDYGDNALKLPN